MDKSKLHFVYDPIKISFKKKFQLRELTPWIPSKEDEHELYYAGKHFSYVALSLAFAIGVSTLIILFLGFAMKSCYSEMFNKVLGMVTV